LAEVRNVIFHLYGEKPPVMGMLPNVACGFPFPTQSFVSDFIFIVPIVFGGGPPKFGCSHWLEGWPLQQLELYRAVLWSL